MLPPVLIKLHKSVFIVGCILYGFGNFTLYTRNYLT